MSRHPLSVAFLLHIALEAPIAIQGIWAPQGLPFMEMNNTTLVMLKLYAGMSLAMSIVSFLCFTLPEFLPGKRAFVIGLLIYHSICSTILIQAPRFIPHSFGNFFESYNFTPEVLWGCLHGFTSMVFAFWWQSTIGTGQAQVAKAK